MPQKLKFGKNTDEFSRNRSVSRPGKLKFRKHFWMNFPRFANKGKVVVDYKLKASHTAPRFPLWYWLNWDFIFYFWFHTVETRKERKKYWRVSVCCEIFGQSISVSLKELVAQCYLVTPIWYRPYHTSWYLEKVHRPKKISKLLFTKIKLLFKL